MNVALAPLLTLFGSFLLSRYSRYGDYGYGGYGGLARYGGYGGYGGYGRGYGGYVSMLRFSCALTHHSMYSYTSMMQWGC